MPSPKRTLFIDPLTGCVKLARRRSAFGSTVPSERFRNQWRLKSKHPANGFRNLTLCLTDRCNLSCRYCWQAQMRKPAGSDMSFETISHWLHFFLETNPATPSKITYYGGEPLLRIDLLEYSAKMVQAICSRKRTEPPRQHVFTNGTMLTSSVLDIFGEHHIFPIISLDGDATTTNTHRVSINGVPAWAAISKGISRLKDRGLPFGVSCTLSRLQFDVETCAGYLVNEVRPNSIEFCLRHDRDAKRIYGNQQIEFASLFSAWDLCLKKGVYIVDLAKRIRPLIDRIPLHNSSSGCKNKLAVMPNGKISPFNGAVVFPELQVAPESLTWQKLFSKVWNREVRTQIKCDHCPAIFICGQGSAFSSYIQHSVFDRPPVLHCEYSLALLDFLGQRLDTQFCLRGQNSSVLDVPPEEIASLVRMPREGGW